MIDEDEDVVLGKSPLDEYLQEVTPLSFSKYNYNEPINVNSLLKKDKENNSEPFKFHTVISKLRQKEILKSCQMLIQLSCLTEDDGNLLCDLKDEVMQSLKEVSCRESFYLDKNYTFLGLMGVILSIFFAYLTNIGKYEEALAFTFFVVILGFCLWYYYKSMFSLSNSMLQSTIKLCDVLNDYDNLLDKVVMYLKEIEVINHGYVSFRFDLATSCLKDSDKGRKCLKLRNNVMNGLIDVFMKTRTNLRVLLQNVSKDYTLDYKEEYIAFMSLDAFSEVLNLPSRKDSTELEYIPLEQIKSMIICYRCLMSEFIYKVTVSLYYAGQELHEEQIVQDALYSADSVYKNVFNAFETLEHYLDSSHKLIYEREKRSQSKVLYQEKTVESLLHSSEVYLHSALTRIDEMKQIFLTDQQLSGSTEHLDVLKTLLVQYNLAIDNSKTCVEDAAGHVLPTNLKQNASPISYDESEESNVTTYIKFVESVEPEGDALFEGESEENPKNSYVNCNIEDMEKAIKESRESKKLMKELKTILSVKDTPIGLLPFPLQKPNVNEGDSDSEEEFMCGEQADTKTKKSYTNKYSYNYDPNENSDDHDDVSMENDKHESVTRIGLPISFLQNLPSQKDVIEETFGSTDEEDNSYNG